MLQWRCGQARRGEEGLLRWLRRDRSASASSRNGRRPSLEAWSQWSGPAARAEQWLSQGRGQWTALREFNEGTSEPERRAISRLLGMPLRQMLLNFRRRHLLGLAAAQGRISPGLVNSAGYSTPDQCAADFEASFGESIAHVLARHGLLGALAPSSPGDMPELRKAG